MARQRQRLKKLWPVALGIEAAAVAVQCSPALLKRAIDAGTLEIFENPETGHKRILVESLTDYIRREWRRTTYRKERQS
jgi:hypothetical protein